MFLIFVLTFTPIYAVPFIVGSAGISAVLSAWNDIGNDAGDKRAREKEAPIGTEKSNTTDN